MDVITIALRCAKRSDPAGRVFTVSVLLPDKPGELVNVATIIAKLQGKLPSVWSIISLSA